MRAVSRRGLVAAVAVVAAVVALSVAIVQMRTAALEAHAAERASARAAFDEELATLRVNLSKAAVAAEDAAAALRSALGEKLTGSDREPDDVLDDVDRHVAELRAAAVELEAAAGQPPPARPGVLTVAEIDPVYASIEALEEQARDLAGDLHAAADAGAEYGAAAHALGTAAAAFAASVDELPDSDDPDRLADAWSDELDRLAPYRDAVEGATAVAGLADLADVHRDIVDALTELAEGAVEDLEEGDVDGYNERLVEALAQHDRDTVRDALADATSEALEKGAIVQLHAARERALGLVAELDGLERVDPGTDS